MSTKMLGSEYLIMLKLFVVDINLRFISESLTFLRSVYVNVYTLSSVSRNAFIACAVVP